MDVSTDEDVPWYTDEELKDFIPLYVKEIIVTMFETKKTLVETTTLLYGHLDDVKLDTVVISNTNNIRRLKNKKAINIKDPQQHINYILTTGLNQTRETLATKFNISVKEVVDVQIKYGV